MKRRTIDQLLNEKLREGKLSHQAVRAISSITNHAIRTIIALLRRVEFDPLTIATDSRNAEGKAIAVIEQKSYQACIEACHHAGSTISSLITGESTQPHHFPTPENYPTLTVAIKTIDGVENIGKGAVSTLIGLYHTTALFTKPIASLCVVYSLTPIAYLGIEGLGVYKFARDEISDDFLLTKEHVTIPTKGHTYSINTAYQEQWDQKTKKFVEWLEKSDTARTLRYEGVLGSELRRIIELGGVFGYPATKHHPDGKLFLLLQAKTIAHLATLAHGQAVNSSKDAILDIPVDHNSLHRHTPLFFGSQLEINTYKSID